MSNFFTKMICICFMLPLGLNDVLAQKTCGSYISDANWEVLKKSLKTKAASRGEIFIPVVVHIVQHEDSIRISEEQVYSQIRVLNEDFNGQNEFQNSFPQSFKAFIADVGITFCLVNETEEGETSTGIIYSTTDINEMGNRTPTVSNGRVRLKHTSTGGQSAWNTEKYLNIWVADTNVSGWTLFPNEGREDEQGVVINSIAFGGTPATYRNPDRNRGHILTHEIGHYFGLKHLWGASLNDCTTDDGFEDTPSQKSFYFDCPQGQPFSCESLDMYVNHMDFTSDDCKGMFTPMQKSFILDVLNNSRSGLMQTATCGFTNAENPQKEKIVLYPNPSNGYIQIMGNHEYSFTVYDVAGKIIEKGTASLIDLTTKKAGCYFIKINNTIQKIILY